MRAARAALIAAIASACATARPPVLDGARYDALIARDLPAFEQRVALDTRAMPRDDGVRVARAWADLVSCRTIERRAPRGREAALLHTALRLEQARFDRLRDTEALARTWLTMLEDADSFEREPRGEEPYAIRWPAEREAWIDELPIRQPVASECAQRPPRAAREHEEALAERLAALANDPGEPFASLRWRARWHAAALAYERGDHELSRRRLAAIAQAPAAITAQERAEAALMHALLEDDPTRALAIVRPHVDAPLTASLRFTLRYRALTLAVETGDLGLARELSAPLPPRDHPLHDALAFIAARVLAEQGDYDALYRVASSALRDRPLRDDRFRRATLTLALSELARTTFDARVVELIEDLGPREELVERMAELTVLALDQNEPAIADAASRWLHEHDRNARQRRQYLAWLALAALLRDDEPTFDVAVERIVARPAAVRAAVGARRAPEFFREHDRALTVLLGEALPRIAEWEDAPRARRWIERIVAHIQGFVRETPSSLEREPLLALYRVASAMLHDAPRGYSEHVARRQPPPVVLGRVQLPWPDPEPPRIEPLVTPVASFALIPRGDRPTEWALAWPGEEPQ